MASETLGEVLEQSRAPERKRHLPAASVRRRWHAVLAVAAVILIGLNLRAGIASAAALYHDLQQVLGYGPLVAAVLPSIPTLCFAIAGAATAWLTRRVGLERTIAFALLLLTAGLVVRAVPSVGVLMLGTVVGMSGLAICNVAMPSFIRKHYAHRTSAMTGVYTITMSIGATAAAAASVPLAMQLQAPTLGLAAWALLGAVALLAFLPLAAAARPVPVAESGPAVSPWPLLATRKGLLITGFFTVQALLGYAVFSWLPYILISGGLDAAQSGLMLAIMQIVNIPAVVVLLTMASRPRLLRPAFMLATAALLAGLLGLLLLPIQLVAVPALLLGVGFAVFPLVLMVISRSGRNAAETTAMSTLAQSVGYFIATLGPFGLGLLHAASGSWTLPLVLLVAVAVLQMVLAYWLSGSGRSRADGTANDRKQS
ncbi:MFS transporter [Arthrobacter mobilis]|uniref:MFS transporter n=1 Tax=Arthrobacter mobilis TaxID=2724944 RepID=A0A7X6HCX9_9MICC|nr:MFS transporter [Arthrobacter mobilis]NKX54225.1 MFS transporter [Arthrobacter mobilis]